MSEIVQAVIDLGSTSSRLLIGTAGAVLHREQIVTQMGTGIDATAAISDEALERVDAALAHFAQELSRFEVAATRVVATAAAREVRDTSGLRLMVERTTGAQLEILSGEDEGRFAFLGAVAREEPGSLVVVDIGGRSTEVIVGSLGDGVLGSISLPTGASRLTEEFIEQDPPAPAELAGALSVAGLHLDDVARELPQAATVLQSGTVIGVGGTITTAVAVELGLLTYDADVVDGFLLSKEAAEDVFRTLATENHADRAHNPGLHPDRVGVIVGGMCMLVGLMRRFGIDEIKVSERDLLDGVLQEMTQS